MLAGQSIPVEETVEARKVKIGAEQAWELIRKKEELAVGRGKKYLVFAPSEETREEILKLVLGRTGNLRAPTLQLSACTLVGFNDEMYSRYFG